MVLMNPSSLLILPPEGVLANPGLAGEQLRCAADARYDAGLNERLAIAKRFLFFCPGALVSSTMVSKYHEVRYTLVLWS
jgi:hypothetical protein